MMLIHARADLSKDALLDSMVSLGLLQPSKAPHGVCVWGGAPSQLPLTDKVHHPWWKRTVHTPPVKDEIKYFEKVLSWFLPCLLCSNPDLPPAGLVSASFHSINARFPASFLTWGGKQWHRLCTHNPLLSYCYLLLLLQTQ